MWIWQQQDWSTFTWDRLVIEPRLGEVLLKQGILFGIRATAKLLDVAPRETT
ncbi:TPA: DUF4172 domain-containing protein [Photobacterium damselae]